MASLSNDLDDESLDDPIRLIFDDDMATVASSQLLDDGIPEPKQNCNGYNFIRSMSKSGRRKFTLPMSFFQVANNIEHLNDCRPLCIKIVDCNKYPWYYNKRKKNKVKPSEIITEDNDILVKNKNGTWEIISCENNYNSINCNSQTHKENMLIKNKQKSLKGKMDQEYFEALSKKNTKDIDYKKNTGLIGVRITNYNVVKNKSNAQDVPKIKNKKVSTSRMDSQNTSHKTFEKERVSEIESKKIRENIKKSTAASSKLHNNGIKNGASQKNISMSELIGFKISYDAKQFDIKSNDSNDKSKLPKSNDGSVSISKSVVSNKSSNQITLEKDDNIKSHSNDIDKLFTINKSKHLVELKQKMKVINEILSQSTSPKTKMDKYSFTMVHQSDAISKDMTNKSSNSIPIETKIIPQKQLPEHDRKSAIGSSKILYLANGTPKTKIVENREAAFPSSPNTHHKNYDGNFISKRKVSNEPKDVSQAKKIKVQKEYDINCQKYLDIRLDTSPLHKTTTTPNILRSLKPNTCHPKVSKSFESVDMEEKIPNKIPNSVINEPQTHKETFQKMCISSSIKIKEAKQNSEIINSKISAGHVQVSLTSKNTSTTASNKNEQKSTNMTHNNINSPKQKIQESCTQINQNGKNSTPALPNNARQTTGYKNCVWSFEMSKPLQNTAASNDLHLATSSNEKTSTFTKNTDVEKKSKQKIQKNAKNINESKSISQQSCENQENIKNNVVQYTMMANKNTAHNEATGKANLWNLDKSNALHVSRVTSSPSTINKNHSQTAEISDTKKSKNKVKKHTKKIKHNEGKLKIQQPFEKKSVNKSHEKQQDIKMSKELQTIPANSTKYTPPLTTCDYNFWNLDSGSVEHSHGYNPSTNHIVIPQQHTGPLISAPNDINQQTSMTSLGSTGSVVNFASNISNSDGNYTPIGNPDNPQSTTFQGTNNLNQQQTLYSAYPATEGMHNYPDNYNPPITTTNIPYDTSQNYYYPPNNYILPGQNYDPNYYNYPIHMPPPNYSEPLPPLYTQPPPPYSFETTPPQPPPTSNLQGGHSADTILPPPSLPLPPPGLPSLSTPLPSLPPLSQPAPPIEPPVPPYSRSATPTPYQVSSSPQTVSLTSKTRTSQSISSTPYYYLVSVSPKSTAHSKTNINSNKPFTNSVKLSQESIIGQNINGLVRKINICANKSRNEESLTDRAIGIVKNKNMGSSSIPILVRSLNSKYGQLSKAVLLQNKKNPELKSIVLYNPRNNLKPVTKPPNHNNNSPIQNAHSGYSPPILPIPTYEKTLEILSRGNSPFAANPNKIDQPLNQVTSLQQNTSISYQKKQTGSKTYTTQQHTKKEENRNVKKISLHEYKKRVLNDIVDLTDDRDSKNQKICRDKMPKATSKDSTDNLRHSTELDLGYDSDCTVKI